MGGGRSKLRYPPFEWLPRDSSDLSSTTWQWSRPTYFSPGLFISFYYDITFSLGVIKGSPLFTTQKISLNDSIQRKSVIEV